jgi:phosphatidylglycerophosphate synthase
VTLAVLLAPDPSSPPVPTTADLPPGRLDEQLRLAGAGQVLLAGDLTELAAIAERAAEPLLVCAPDLLAHPAVLRHLATSPLPGSVALVLADPPGPGQAAVAEERGQLTGAGSTADPGAAPLTFGGALRVPPADLPALAAAARAAADATRGGADAAGGGPAGLFGPDRLVAELTRGDTTIFTQRVRLLVAHRPTDRAEASAALAEIAAVDSDAAELRLAVKERDDFFTTYFVSTWSPRVTKLAARLGLTPTGVTAISVLMAIAAAVLFGVGGRPALVTGAVLLYLGFVLDCVDGQLARYTRRFSPWGGWLDTMADRAKEYVVYAGLAVGVDRADLGNGWTLAIAAMVLQTARHMTDTWYGALHDEAARRPAGPAGGGVGDRLGRVSTQALARPGSLVYWLKRTVVFPIGERWALIAITVALFNPLVSLVSVLVWGGLAAAYTLLLRTLRARSMRVAVLPGVDTALHRDDGPLARWIGAAARRLPGRPGPLPFALLATAAAGTLLLAALAGVAGLRGWVVATVLVMLLAALPAAVGHTGALDWLVPAALRAAEYLFVIAIDVAAGVPGPVTFALLFVLALRHYDLTARLEKRERPPLLAAAGLGWDGRILLLAVPVVAGWAAAGTAALAGYLFVILAIGAIAGWATPGTTRATPGTAEERNR